MFDYLIWACFLLFVFPAAVYLTVKLGVYAFFKGKQSFQDDHDQQKKEVKNGGIETRA